MTNNKIKKVADKIASYLFGDNTSRPANRLAMEFNNSQDGRGWFKASVRDVIEKYLNEAQKPKTAKEVLIKYLKRNGYDGLCNPEAKCGCSLNNLVACSSSCEECRPGYGNYHKGEFIVSINKPRKPINKTSGKR